MLVGRERAVSAGKLAVSLWQTSHPTAAEAIACRRMAGAKDGTRVKNKKGKRLSQKDRLRKKRKLEERPHEPDEGAAAPSAVDHASAVAGADAQPAPARTRAMVPGAIERIFEDAEVLALGKPAGMLSHASPGFWTHGTVAHALLLPPLAGRIPQPMLEESKASAAGKDSVVPRAMVHTLDRGTTGVMLLAKTPRAEAHLAAQFRARGAKKRYVAVLHALPRLEGRRAAAAGAAATAHRLYVDAPVGRDPERAGGMCLLPPPDGRSAVSVFHVHAHCAARALSLVSVELHTARQQQVRVHAARVLGAPVANDETYGERAAVERLRSEFGGLGRGRPLLHAWSLEVPHPNPAAASGLSLRCPLPADMLQIIERAWPALSRDPSEWPQWEGDADEAVAAQEEAAAAVDPEQLANAAAKRKKAKPAGQELSLVSDTAMAAFARSYKPPQPRASDVPRAVREAATAERNAPPEPRPALSDRGPKLKPGSAGKRKAA